MLKTPNDKDIKEFLLTHKQMSQNHKDSNPSENSVASTSSVYRDTYIIKEIIKYWNEGKSIFIIYGSGHAIVQEPALKKLLI